MTAPSSLRSAGPDTARGSGSAGAGSGAGGHPSPTAPSFTSEALFGSAREVRIEHRGALYRLKLTALGKLILTK